MGVRKPNMAASYRSIREIFMSDWDPIGIRDLNWPDDEYDAYIGPIYDILRGDRSAQALVDYLRWAETVRIEVDLPIERLEGIANKLLSIDVSADEVHQ